MTTASTFNPLAAAHDLEAAGIEPKHAAAIAAQLRVAAIADHDDLATKGDIAALEGRLDARLAALDARLDGRITALRVELRIVGALVFAIAAKLFGLFNAVAAVLS